MYLIQTFKFVIISHSEHYLYGLYVCTCEFSLHRESFDVILVDTRHSTMGVLRLVSERCQSKYMLMKLKNDQQCFYNEERVSPHKNYSSS
jgi:hypothetical protein